MVVVKSIATPIMWVLVLLIGGLLFLKCSKKKLPHKTGGAFLLLGTLILLVFSLRPVSNLLVYSLEREYSPLSPEALSTLDVVVVLGHGVYPPGGPGSEAELSGVGYSRCYNGTKTFLRSNASLLVFSGGRPWKGLPSSAEIMKGVATQMGVSEEKTLIETESNNTIEHAILLEKLLPTERKRQIGIVTSATHMLRSESTFKKQFPNDIIVPIPVNYTQEPMVWTPGSFVPSAKALLGSTVALHEWFGIIWYSLRY